jgi:hypothetical protein
MIISTPETLITITPESPITIIGIRTGLPRCRALSCRVLTRGLRGWGKRTLDRFQALVGEVQRRLDPDPRDCAARTPVRTTREGLWRWLGLLEDRVRGECQKLLRVWSEPVAGAPAK